jgi:hypothetical protein
MDNIVVTLIRLKNKTHYVEEIKVNDEVIASFDFDLGKIDFQPLANIIDNEKGAEVIFITKYEDDYKPTKTEKATILVSRNKKNELVLDLYVNKKEQA